MSIRTAPPSPEAIARPDLSNAARAFLAYAAGVAEKNADTMDVQDLFDASFVGASAREQLGLLPPLTADDSRAIVELIEREFTDRAFTVPELVAKMRAVST